MEGGVEWDNLSANVTRNCMLNNRDHLIGITDCKFNRMPTRTGEEHKIIRSPSSLAPFLFLLSLPSLPVPKIDLQVERSTCRSNLDTGSEGRKEEKGKESEQLDLCQLWVAPSPFRCSMGTFSKKLSFVGKFTDLKQSRFSVGTLQPNACLLLLLLLLLSVYLFNSTPEPRMYLDPERNRTGDLSPS